VNLKACIGITNGSEHTMFSWMPTIERDNWISDFRRDPIMGEVELVVEGYEPATDDKPPVSKVVRITLMRPGNQQLIYQRLMQNQNLFGIPRLVFFKA